MLGFNSPSYFLFSEARPSRGAEPDGGVRHGPRAGLLRAHHDEGLPPGPRPADQGQQPTRARGVGGAGQDHGCGQGGEPREVILVLT